MCVCTGLVESVQSKFQCIDNSSTSQNVQGHELVCYHRQRQQHSNRQNLVLNWLTHCNPVFSVHVVVSANPQPMTGKDVGDGLINEL